VHCHPITSRFHRIAARIALHCRHSRRDSAVDSRCDSCSLPRPCFRSLLPPPPLACRQPPAPAPPRPAPPQVVVVDEFLGLADALRIIEEAHQMYKDEFLPRRAR
jgi:hypothetical protein